MKMSADSINRVRDAYEVRHNGKTFIYCATPAQIENLFPGSVILGAAHHKNLPCKGYIGTHSDGSIMYHDSENVFRAASGNVADVNSGYLLGRWECSIVHWNQTGHLVFNMPKVGA